MVLEAKDKKTNTRILTTDPAINGAVAGLGVGLIGWLLVGALLPLPTYLSIVSFLIQVSLQGKPNLLPPSSFKSVFKVNQTS